MAVPERCPDDAIRLYIGLDTNDFPVRVTFNREEATQLIRPGGGCASLTWRDLSATAVREALEAWEEGS